MIDRRKYQLNYIKKERQSGSYSGMRFTFAKEEDGLSVTAYPEPFCLEVTPDDKKEKKTFAFTGEGLDAAIDWLNTLYKEKQGCWEEAYAKRMQV